jgi:hypothetical protein
MSYEIVIYNHADHPAVAANEYCGCSDPVNMHAVFRVLDAAGIEYDAIGADHPRVWVAPRDIGPAVEVINAAGYTTDEDDNSAEIAHDVAIENELNASYNE